MHEPNINAGAPTGTPVHILLVEDNPGDARLVREMLAEARRDNFAIAHVDLIAEALKRLGQHHFDVVLLDMTLPDSSGLDSLIQVQAVVPHMPIVVLSGLNDEDLALQAVRHGAQDYLIKGQVDTRLLAHSLRYAIERKRAEEHMHFMATHDVLTKLPNRLLLMDRLSQALARAPRHNRMVAVLFVDVDRFKYVNDTLGHAVGDLALIGVAERLSTHVRESDTVARFGGDEFVLILGDVADPTDVARIAQKINHSISEPFEVAGHGLHITSSIGVSISPNDGADPEGLLKNADLAMYRIKEQGGRGYQLYSPEMNDKTSHRLEMGNKLCHAIERNEMYLHYQPQINLTTGKIVAVEALLRWESPDLGLVSPSEFIAVAEETGLIVPIGAWVLRAACEQNKAWQAAGYPPIRVAVNLSARQFRQQQLLGTINQLLSETGLDPNYLELELTESLMQGIETSDIMNKLKNTGIHLVIDDFGTGYSSLSYLKRFPVTKMKIDQSFVRGIPDDTDDMAITRAIVAMAHSLKLQIIAEGVETMKQLEFLRSLQCTEMQGYYFDRPLPPSKIEECFAHDYMTPSAVNEARH